MAKTSLSSGWTSIAHRYYVVASTLSQWPPTYNEREANIFGFKKSRKEKTWCFAYSFLSLIVWLFVLDSNVRASKIRAWAHNCWRPKRIFCFRLWTNTKLHINNINWNYNVLLPVSFQFMLIFIISGLVILGYCSKVCVSSGRSYSLFPSLTVPLVSLSACSVAF